MRFWTHNLLRVHLAPLAGDAYVEAVLRPFRRHAEQRHVLTHPYPGEVLVEVIEVAG